MEEAELPSVGRCLACCLVGRTSRFAPNAKAVGMIRFDAAPALPLLDFRVSGPCGGRGAAAVVHSCLPGGRWRSADLRRYCQELAPAPYLRTDNRRRHSSDPDQA